MASGLVLLVVLGYYLLLKEFAARGLAACVKRIGARWSVTVPPAIWDDVVRVGVVTVLQVGFVVLLVVVTEVPVSTWFATRSLIGSVSTGVFLGVGEYSTGALLCQMVVRSSGFRIGGRRMCDETVWETLMYAGWMGRYFRARQVLSAVGVVALASIYVVGEEIVFRGVMLTPADGKGFLWVYPASVASFVASQFPGMPEARAAAFPAIGAALIGGVHGALFWTGTDLGTLIIAHMVCIALPVWIHD